MHIYLTFLLFIIMNWIAIFKKNNLKLFIYTVILLLKNTIWYVIICTLFMFQMTEKSVKKINNNRNLIVIK